MPWEITDKYIRSGHRNPEEFQPETMRTITLSEEEGVKAVIGKPKGKETMEVQSYLFDLSKGWTLEKAKEWFEKHSKNEVVRRHFSALLPFHVMEKIVDKPLRIRGIALTAGMSRNLNIYTADELKSFADKLIGAPVYIEHVAVPNAVGKVIKAEWDGANLWYEAEIYDEETADKIRMGLVRHVSIGADYETIDMVNGKVPHGLHNAELSLVAVPGIPEANIQIMEKLVKEQAQAYEPTVAGEYVLGFYQDFAAFMPEHFSLMWLDKPNGILAILGRLRSAPETQMVQSIFFLKEKMWDENKIRDWLVLHSYYMNTAKTQSASVSLSEALLKNANGTIPIEEVVKMVQNVLPSPMVERSWSLGPQRLCQELRGILYKLRGRVKENVRS
ncbi:MAG: hypothetical protein QXX51_03795 [Candidatus Bathyarchaeia archaeon]